MVLQMGPFIYPVPKIRVCIFDGMFLIITVLDGILLFDGRDIMREGDMVRLDDMKIKCLSNVPSFSSIVVFLNIRNVLFNGRVFWKKAISLVCNN